VAQTPRPPWAGPPLSPPLRRPGSDPSALPTDVLIADKLNNRLIIVDPQGRIRWQFPRPGDVQPGATFRIPDDAFFSADGTKIIATQEDNQILTVIDVASRRIVYRYGTPGRPGSRAGLLDNPDDAMLLPNGEIVTADIKNCRLLVIRPPAHQPARIIGRTTQACRHAPPTHWGSPNGAFPMADGHYLVTEINGAHVSELGPGDAIAWSVRVPGVTYPSDSNEISPGRYLTVDYSTPGQVVIFNRAGRTLYRYAPSSPGARLDHPSLALPLPNGDVLVTDDRNHRVLVLDPRSSRIVWQYGHTGVAGRAPGYLDNPDGLDLVPPHGLLAVHASTLRSP